MTEKTISAVVTGRSITIQPTRLALQSGVTNQAIRWLARGQNVAVSDVDFTKSPTAPISDLREDPQNPGQWIGTWDTTQLGVFQYAVALTQNGVPLGPPVDPEIENDPGGKDDDDDQGDDDGEG